MQPHILRSLFEWKKKKSKKSAIWLNTVGQKSEAKNIHVRIFFKIYGEKNWKNLCTHLLVSFCKARVEGNVQLAYNKTLLTFLVYSKLLIRNLLESFSLLHKLVHLYTKLISPREKSKKIRNPSRNIGKIYSFQNTYLHTFNFCSYNIDIFWKFGSYF